MPSEQIARASLNPDRIARRARERDKWGPRKSLTAERLMICDLMHFARKLPSIPVQRRMKLARLRDARQQSVPRPAWTILFAKAFARIARGAPELRTAYLEFPWPHLYEHPTSVASIAVEKLYNGVPIVSFAKLREPSDRPVKVLDRYLKGFANSPNKNLPVAHVARWLRYFWRPIRHFAWWSGLNLDGFFRARQFGTFGISAYSRLGAESLHPLSPLTFLLNYGVIADDGTVDVRLVYDHRVLDGATVARALESLENVLNSEIADELLMATGRSPSQSK